MNPYVKNLERIEFIITNACTGRCKHCSEGDHPADGEHISPKTAEALVRRVCGEYRIHSVMTFGGEPLLHPDTVCAAHSAAREMGIPRRQLITNGFFSRDPEKIAAVAKRLVESGINEVLLSVDAFHQETIPLEPVKCFAKAVRTQEIRLETSPAWLVSKTDNNPYNLHTREVLKEFSELGVPEAGGNVIFPSGNALVYLKEYFTGELPKNPYEEDPRDIHTLSISPNGDSEELKGNVIRQDVLELLRNYDPEKK